MKVYFRPVVVRDLRDISVYTREQFGPAQEVKYLEGLFQHFDLLADFPRMAPEYRPGGPVRISTYREHRVLYQEYREGIRVNRVVHHTRQLERLLRHRSSSGQG